MIFSLSTPVSCSTRSGSYSRTFAFSSAKYSVLLAINSLFSQPFSIMTLISPFNRAILLPTARFIQTSALAAIQVLRGSVTMSFAPLFVASFK
ncbi:MAG: hypothetical protein ACD_75C01777G0002 [uncultured bacterium]|nr:MAG: hypothetical protein ACD_75C01777G0002 [uncultured bacterium]